MTNKVATVNKIASLKDPIARCWVLKFAVEYGWLQSDINPFMTDNIWNDKKKKSLNNIAFIGCAWYVTTVVHYTPINSYTFMVTSFLNGNLYYEDVGLSIQLYLKITKIHNIIFKIIMRMFLISKYTCILKPTAS